MHLINWSSGRVSTSMNIFPVCTSGAFKCVNRILRRKDSENQMLLPVNLARVILQWKQRLFTHGKHSRQWTSDQNKDMVRPCNAQRNFRKPKRTSQRLQASVIIINNNKKSSWQQMRKILIDYGLFGRVARRRHFLSNKYLVVCCMWTKHQTSAQIPHKICQHGGGGVMIWLCSATTGPGHPAFMNLTMNNSVH